MQKIIGKRNLPDFLLRGDGVNSRIKLSARGAISGSYMKVLPLTVIIFLLTAVFSLLNAVLNRCSENGAFLVVFSVVSLMVFVVLVSPLRLILQLRFLVLAKGKSGFMMPAIGFADILKACELSVRLFILKLFRLLIFEFLPGVFTLIFIEYASRNAVSLRAAYAVFAGIVSLAVAGFVFYLITVQKYSESWFFLACYSDFTAADAIKESTRKTKNKLAEIFFFKLGFVPWFMLCAMVLPALFVVPYYKQSVTCYYLSR